MRDTWEAEQEELLNEISQSIRDLGVENVAKLEKFHASICECSPEDKEACADLYIRECLQLLVEREIADELRVQELRHRKP